MRSLFRRGEHRAGQPDSVLAADIIARVAEEPPRTWPVGATGIWNIMNDGMLMTRCPVTIGFAKNDGPPPYSAHLVATGTDGIENFPAVFPAGQ